MAVDRKIWNKTFYQLTFPCPKCGGNSFVLNYESLQSKETKESKSRDYDEFDAYDFEGKFLGFMECHNCKEIGVVCGHQYLEPQMVHDEEGPQIRPTSSYRPVFFEPAPPVFNIPEQCPKGVGEHIASAFSLLWADHGACANRLRVALEEMVNNLHVQGSAEGSLDTKIKAIESSDPELFTQLMALKLLGNFGSHNEPQGLGRDEILDAFEHFERALNLAYVQNDRRLRERAEKIIENRGPER